MPFLNRMSLNGQSDTNPILDWQIGKITRSVAGESGSFKSLYLRAGKNAFGITAHALAIFI